MDTDLELLAEARSFGIHLESIMPPKKQKPKRKPKRKPEQKPKPKPEPKQGGNQIGRAHV